MLCSEFRRCAKAAARARLRHCNSEWEGNSADPQELQYIIVYALGSPANSQAARYQLALALAVSQVAGKQCAVEAYDPAFTDVDRRLLQAYGWKVSRLPARHACAGLN